MLEKLQKFIMREKNILCKKVKPTHDDYKIAVNLCYFFYLPIASIILFLALSKVNNLTDQNIPFYFSLFGIILLWPAILYISAHASNDT